MGYVSISAKLLASKGIRIEQAGTMRVVLRLENLTLILTAFSQELGHDKKKYDDDEITIVISDLVEILITRSPG